jgi:hypothetical protein
MVLRRAEASKVKQQNSTFFRRIWVIADVFTFKDGPQATKPSCPCSFQGEKGLGRP